MHVKTAGTRRRSVRRWLSLVVSAGVLAAVAVSPASANLAGSPFEGGDGNLIVNTAGNTDWINAPALVPKVETNSGSSDDSLGQGSKEDDLTPTPVTGSIPPNKSDLSRFYVSHNSSGGNFYLNLAWERTNVLGSANMDFEFNKSSTLSGNNVTPVRSAGDMLITFDFTNGGGNPVLGLLRWVTTGPTSQCFSNNSLPCWGNRVNLSAAGFAEGAVNSGTVTDPIQPNAPRSLSALTFGEASINLTAAQVFPPGQCVNFASSYLKSRSSAQFNSELKDFVAPANASISNCGRIRIHKMTDPTGAPGSFGYTTTPTGTGGLTPSTFSLSDQGTQDYQNIQAGSYSFTENDPTPAFDLTDLTCVSATGDSSISTNLLTRKATIGLAVADVVDCTYTNRQRGAIVIKKVTDPSTDTTTSFPFTTGGGLSPGSFSLFNGGSQTFADIVPGSGYSVAEQVPAGWNLTSMVCDDGSPVTNISVAAGKTTTCTFTDQANGSIAIHKSDDSKAGKGLQGAVFTLYVDNAPLDGTARDGGDTITTKTCTTDASGDCTITDVRPGQYWVVETTGVPGHDLAADQNVVVTAGQTTAPLNFTDPRKFTVITLVCQESNSTLYPSDITVDGQHKTSLATGGGGAISDAALCSLGGASYSGKHFGDHPADVNIPQ